MDELQKTFCQLFGETGKTFRVFAPYRVCPLGAHVDHQHGLVSGFAINSGIDFLLAPIDTGRIEMASLSFSGLMTFAADRPIGLDDRQGNWGDYLRGAVYALQADFTLRRGLRGVIKGSMPIGGVSSSAALLCGMVMALAEVNELSLSKMQVINYASVAERMFVGLNNGILDQACVVLCEKDKLLFLDTETSDYKLIPYTGCRQFKVAVIFSGVTRKLTGTDYNLRVSECRTAAWIAQAYNGDRLKELQDTRLRDLPQAIFHQYDGNMPERFARRARHFYSECERVERGVEAWKRGDIESFGQLMFESCDSSRYQYECGSEELCALEDIARETDGIYGGRFSGAGFKGAFIALADPAKTESIRGHVAEKYLARFPKYRDSFAMFFCDTCDGVSVAEMAPNNQ